MIVACSGRMGQGKTLSLTALAMTEQEQSGKKIFSTFHLYSVADCPQCGLTHRIIQYENEEAYVCPTEDKTYLVNGNGITVNYEYMTLERFYEIFKQTDEGELDLTDCLFLLDEAYLFMDARTSGSKVNRLFNSFLFQMRKRDVDAYISSHDISRLDKRLRAAIDLNVSCRFNPQTQIVTMRLKDMHTGARRRLKFFGPKFYAFYDTKEIVVPTGKLYRLNEGDLR